jgi:hypothetical protein
VTIACRAAHARCPRTGWQGFYLTTRYILSDPVIHSNRREGESGFGRTDRGAAGFCDFFRTHVCNGLCRALGLPPTDPASVGDGADDQRERLCVICEDELRQVRFGCGHACACVNCARPTIELGS